MNKIISMLFLNLIFCSGMYVSDNRNYLSTFLNYDSETAGELEITSISAKISYIYHGFFELGLGFLSIDQKNSPYGFYDVKGNGISLEIGYYIKNKSSVNIGILGDYKTITLSNDILELARVEMSGDAYTLSMKAFKKVLNHSYCEITPFVSFSKRISTTIVGPFPSPTNYIESESDKNALIGGLGIKIWKILVEPTVIVVDPDLRRGGTNDPNFSFNIGLIIP